MAYGYPPLDFTKQGEDMDLSGYTIRDIIKTMLEIDVPPDITEEDIISFVASNNFMYPKYDKNDWYKTLNDAALNKTPVFMALMGTSIKDALNGKMDPITEMRDLIISHPLFEKWSAYKQIYKPDADFAKALINTDKMKIAKEQMEHLPINAFYLDLSELKIDPIHGAFVFIYPNNDGVSIIIINLTYDLIFFSSYFTMTYADGNELSIMSKDIQNRKEFTVVDSGPMSEMYGKKYYFDSKSITTLVLQLLTYMGVAEKDIKESETTKRTYRPRKPGAKIKNKFSELQMFDVGFYYGSKFRKKIKELGIDPENLTFEDDEIKTGGKHKTHKSPHPHLRQAHWSHYWCGHGEKKELQRRWIEPTFVGFGDNAIANAATIHEIKGD